VSFDWKRLNMLDRAIAIGAGVAFIAAFLPWYGATVGPFSASVSGWSAGFSAWAGALLLTAAGVLLVLLRSGFKLPSTGVGPAVLVAGVSGLGLLLVIIRWISFPRYHGADVGARYGIYLALIAGIAEVAAAVSQMRASGEQMPWAQAQQSATQAEPSPPAQQAPAPPAQPEPEADAPAAPEE
jgi:hypothetical protein